MVENEDEGGEGSVDQYMNSMLPRKELGNFSELEPVARQFQIGQSRSVDVDMCRCDAIKRQVGSSSWVVMWSGVGPAPLPLAAPGPGRQRRLSTVPQVLLYPQTLSLSTS